MSKTKFLSRYVTLALLASCFGATAQTTSSYIRTSCGFDSTLSQDRIISAPCSSPNFLAEAAAQSKWGHLGVFAASKALAFDPRGPRLDVESTATAGIADRVTITSGNLTGLGSLTFSYYLDALGFSSATLDPLGFNIPAVVGSQASSVRYLDAMLSVNQHRFRTTAIDGLTVTASGPNSDGNAIVETATDRYALVDNINTSFENAFGTKSRTIRFEFGVPFDISMDFTVFSYVLAVGIAESFSRIDSQNSFDWAGIESVTFNGDAVPFTLTSASGTDWTQSFAPIPEPSTYALMLLGILAMLGVKRSRSRK